MIVIISMETIFPITLNAITCQLEINNREKVSNKKFFKIDFV